MANPEDLTDEKIEVFKKFEGNTPAYVLFEKDIKENISKLKDFTAPFGLQVRYAMKANSNLSILKLMDNMGIWIDASSINECYRAMAAGIDGRKILLTSQDVPTDAQLKDLVEKGIEYNATSLLQLEKYGELFPNSSISIRFNVGIGSGWNSATSTGGMTSSFGIYDQIENVKELLNKYNLKLKRVHLHIGSGSDSKKQKGAALKGLEIVEQFSSVEILNLGGGIKIARMNYEKQTDIKELSMPTAKAIEEFAQRTGRQIKLEIEPGGSAIGNEEYIVGTVKDVVTTGEYDFIKLDTGMTDNARISMYGAQHPLNLISMSDEARSLRDYVVVGSCCESGDILTCKAGEPEELAPRTFPEAKPGDLMIVGGSGAYCSSMATFNYNSKQRSPEYLVRENCNIDMIRKRQELEDIWKDEVILEDL